jgi:hypothetical protein
MGLRELLLRVFQLPPHLLGFAFTFSKQLQLLIGLLQSSVLVPKLLLKSLYALSNSWVGATSGASTTGPARSKLGQGLGQGILLAR